MGRIVIASGFAATLAVGVMAQSGGRPPFKLGTFERGGRAFIGVAVRDTQVVDLSEANAALERRNASSPKVRMPADMKELIQRYDSRAARPNRRHRSRRRGRAPRRPRTTSRR